MKWRKPLTEAAEKIKKLEQQIQELNSVIVLLLGFHGPISVHKDFNKKIIKIIDEYSNYKYMAIAVAEGENKDICIEDRRKAKNYISKSKFENMLKEI